MGNRLTKSGTLADADYIYNSLNQLTSKTETRKAITVSGTVEDNSGIEGVTVNGVDAIIDANTDTFHAMNIPVTPGQQNALTATAIDTAGNTADSTPVTVEHMGPSTATYTYDANGNLESKDVDSEVTTYEYDYENRLTKVYLPDTTTNEFVYDGDKRRISRKNATEETTKFLYDGLNILKDLDETGQQEIASYVQGVGLDSLISREENGEVAYFHADALGSTRVMTDSNQETVAQYDFDVWGKELIGTGSTNNEYTYTGRRKEDDIGLMFYRARFYDPEIGRFTTPDPLTGGPDDPTISYQNNIYAFASRIINEFVSSMDPHRYRNRYSYCNNNPINFTDPLGLSRITETPEEEFEEWLEGENENETTMEDMGDEFARENVNDEIDESDLTEKERRDLKDYLGSLSNREFVYFVGEQGKLAAKNDKNAPEFFAQVAKNPINWPTAYKSKPGDSFLTQEIAAKAALGYIASKSVKHRREYGGHLIKNSDGTYRYATPMGGTGASVYLGSKPSNSTAYYHSHGAESVYPRYDDEIFSGPDILIAIFNSIDAYLVTPSGAEKKFPFPRGPVEVLWKP